MPFIEIYISQSNLDAAARIGPKMFEEFPDLIAPRHVIATAVMHGMESLRAEWNDTDAPVEDWGTAKEVK